MRIVIIGANGAFGGAMCRYFYNCGYEVIACGRQKSPPPALLKFASYKQIDITLPFELPDGDVLIHAAANSDDKAKMADLETPNIIGTRNVALASSHFKKFIYISSSSVYLPDPNPITEDMAGNQNNQALSAYGLSKLKSEEILKEVSKHESCFILRARAFYGPGDTQILPRLLKLVRRDIFTKPGPLNINLSMTHYTNMGHAIACCIMSSLKGIHTYNIADDKVYLMSDVLRKYFAVLFKKELPEKQISIRFLKILAFFRIGGFTPLLVRALTQNMVLDISKIKKELNYTSLTDFYQEVDLCGEWVQSIGGVEKIRNPEWGLCWK